MIIKCPVCEGRGVVQQGFYNPYGIGMTTSLEPDECRTCNGTTVIDDSRFLQAKAARTENLPTDTP